MPGLRGACQLMLTSSIGDPASLARGPRNCNGSTNSDYRLYASAAAIQAPSSMQRSALRPLASSHRVVVVIPVQSRWEPRGLIGELCRKPSSRHHC